MPYDDVVAAINNLLGRSRAATGSSAIADTVNNWTPPISPLRAMQLRPVLSGQSPPTTTSSAMTPLNNALAGLPGKIDIGKGWTQFDLPNPGGQGYASPAPAPTMAPAPTPMAPAAARAAPAPAPPMKPISSVRPAAPTRASSGLLGAVQAAKAAGFTGDSLIKAVAISLAENGSSDPTEFSKPNRDGSIDRGLWQINTVHNWLSDEDSKDPLKNAMAAFKISNGGKNWKPWTTFNSKAYQKYLRAAQNAVAQAG